MSIDLSRVYRAAYEYQKICEGLIAADPSLADPENEETLLDTLEGCTNLNEALAAIIRSAKVDEAFAGGLADMIASLSARKSRLQHRAERKRALVVRFMSDNGLKKIEAPDFTATRKAVGPGVIITNENLIPERLQRIRREPNKTEIKKALVNGEEVPGAELSNGGETIQVRT